MNCQSARALLTLFRRESDQFDAVERAALDRHLAACPTCAEWSRGDRQIDAAFASAMKNVMAPVGLEGRIRDRLAASRAPRPWGWIAAAACLVVAVGVGALVVSLPQTVDLVAVATKVDDPPREPREMVEAHFAELGYRIVAPSELKYEKYLRSYDMVMFQNRRVPRLTLLGARGGRLNVYILSTSSFSLPAEVDGVELPTQSERHVLAQRAGEFIYVYEWTGDALTEVSNVPH